MVGVEFRLPFIINMIMEVLITQVFIQNKVKADHAEVSTHPITREKQRYLRGIVEIS